MIKDIYKDEMLYIYVDFYFFIKEFNDKKIKDKVKDIKNIIKCKILK